MGKASSRKAARRSGELDSGTVEWLLATLRDLATVDRKTLVPDEAPRRPGSRMHVLRNKAPNGRGAVGWYMEKPPPPIRVLDCAVAEPGRRVRDLQGSLVVWETDGSVLFHSRCPHSARAEWLRDLVLDFFCDGRHIVSDDPLPDGDDWVVEGMVCELPPGLEVEELPAGTRDSFDAAIRGLMRDTSQRISDWDEGDLLSPTAMAGLAAVMVGATGS